MLPIMLRMRFATSLTTASKGARALHVIAPAHRYTAKRLPKLGDKRTTDLVLTIAKDLAPGSQGATAATYTGRDPKLVVVTVLPDSVSRHNSPARADAIRAAIAAAPGVDRGVHRGTVAIALLLDDPAHALAAVNAVGRGLPGLSFKRKPAAGTARVVCLGPAGEVVPLGASIKATVGEARLAAELVDTPPTTLDPAAFDARATELLAALPGVTLERFVGDVLLARGLRAIHAVGRSAVAPPRMLVASWTPPHPSGLHVGLVGKGITFDTGGLHLKGRGAMETMKADMGGAAAVLGAFRALVQGGCPHRLSLVLCMAENAIGPASYKPDDVIEAHSGLTIEINNTDAEGRLLLADGCSYAARELEVDVLLDAATLTGAQSVATGLRHAAIVSDDAELEAKAIAAGRHSGDLVHPLPFAPEFFMPEFDSPIADMVNSVANRNNAASSCAAQFVYAHLADAPGAAARRWCHVDLAGPAYPGKRATGYGVALLAELVRTFA
jgi:probable aminopeptidase NPEPL1